MTYQDHYEEYLNQIPARLAQACANKRRIAIGYTSDVDAITRWDPDAFNRLLADHLAEEPSFTEGENIATMADFARILCWYAMRGAGGEVDIVNYDVITALEEYFTIDYGLGGTCAQGSAALGILGAPILIHLTDRSGDVTKQLNMPTIETIVEGHAQFLRACTSKENPLIHLIVQFSKGDILHVRGRDVEIPLSNRLIMGCDTVHKVVPIEPAFLAYLEDHIQDLCAYNISGFNAIIDEDIIKERIAQLIPHFHALKEKRPELPIYYESAYFINEKVRDTLYAAIAPYVDIIGMNEEELFTLSQSVGAPIDVDDIETVICCLDQVIDLLKPRHGIVLHSKDYALFYGTALPGMDIEMALTCGNLLSGSRAYSGTYASLEQCREYLASPLSTTGCRFYETLSRMQTKHTAVLVPSRYLEHPACTIGLGDTFVAGVQLAFV